MTDLANSAERFVRDIPGDSELATLVRAFEWSQTSLGSIETWPQSLKTVTAVLLASSVPMVMLWGADGVMIYNDAYSVFAGGRHPEQLGSKVREGWPEVADFNDNVMRVGLAGGSLAYQNIEMALNRKGRPEAVWMNLDYSPVYDESGKPAGVIAIVVETTEKILEERREATIVERQRRMLQRAPGFVAMLGGPEFVFEYANDAYMEISERSDFIGRPFHEVFPELSSQGYFELLERVYSTGEGIVSRKMPMHLLGSAHVKYVDFLFEPLRDAEGAVTGIFFGGYEITEAHRATLALLESEARLRELNTALEARVTERTSERNQVWSMSRDLFAVMGFDGYLKEINPAWETILGRDTATLLAMPFRDQVHPDDHALVAMVIERLRAGETVERFIDRLRRADGTWRWISWTLVPEADVFYAVGRDVTDNKKHEAELAARTAERDRLWTLSQDMFARANLEGMMSAVSPAWTQVLGWSEAELLSRPYATFMHEADMEPTLAALADMGETGQPTRFENRIATSDGDWKWIEWTVAPELEGQNFIAVGRDLSETKSRADELAIAQEALRQAQKMEAVGQLTGGLAHDFNNIIAGISGSLEMMSTRLAQGRISDLDRYINGASGAAKRAASLTQRLLAFSRRQTLEPKPASLNNIVAGMLDLIHRSVGPAINVEAVNVTGLWPTFVDVGQLENALLNLCINARDAMPDGGKLTIETANRWMDERGARLHSMAPGQYVSLCVSDTGTGMTRDVIERAFDPFYTTKPIGEGTGLGLSMVHGFAGQSGGSARIYSEVGKGTMLCIYLPRHLGKDEQEASLDAPEAAPRADDNETVLLVDDEPLVRMIAAEALEDLGYTVIEAADGASALKILNSAQAIDLLVTDVGLPGGINGRQVADAARMSRPDLRVLFITGYAENAVLNHGHLDPGTQVLTKPFQMDVLGRKVRDLIEG